MYHDDDYDGASSGLGAAALFWVGCNWGRSAVAHAAELINRPVFRVSRQTPMICIDDYNALVRNHNTLAANRDEWREHAHKLEKKIKEEWKPAFERTIEERNYYRNEIDELQDELTETSRQHHEEVLRLMSERGTAEVRAIAIETNEKFLFERFVDVANFALQGLSTEPEFRELVERTGEIREELAKYNRRERKYPLDLHDRIDELTKLLTEKRQARKR